MKRGIVLLFTGALALLLVIFVTISQLKSAEQLMSPPNNRGEDAKVTQALKNYLGSDYKKMSLKYPTEGNYRTAYIKQDLDHDGTQEVLVFYTLQSDTTVRFTILQQQDNNWNVIYDQAGYGNSILSVQFIDMNGDDLPEVLLGWSPFDNSTAKTLTVHSWSEENGTNLKTLVNQTYAYMSPVDLDQDSLKEILLIKSDSSASAVSSAAGSNSSSGTPTGTVAYAELLKMTSSNTITTIGSEVTVDGSVSAYGNLTLQQQGDTPIAFLDAYKGTDAMVTELFWWDAEHQELRAPLTSRDSLNNSSTLRSPAIPSCDLDGDGYVDIPVSANAGKKSSKGTSASGQVGLTTWYNYTGTDLGPRLEAHSYGFVDETNSYCLLIPISQKDSLLAFRNTETNVLTIYATEDGTTVGKPLFSLVTTTKADFKEKNPDHSFSVEGKNSVVYGTLTGDGSALGFTNEQIEKFIYFY